MSVMRPPVLIGLVSDRRRLAAAAGVPDTDAAGLLIAQATAAAEAGADFYQIRELDLDAGPLLILVREIAAATRGRLPLFVNDRADVAVAAGLGVHLRSSSAPAARLRGWLPRSVDVTRAVHSAADAQAAGPVDMLIAGTAKPSASKPSGHDTLGADGLRAIVEACAVPVIAIGGLTPADWPWVAATGARGWAAIGVFLPVAGERVDEAVKRTIAAGRALDGSDVTWPDRSIASAPSPRWSDRVH
jgi:thiamine-phosphate pyrophosphorylase